MKLLTNGIKYGFPILLVTDLGSDLFQMELLLNISRFIRIFLLFLFLIENIRYFKIIRHFYFSRTTAFFGFVLFVYIFTDQNPAEGFWIYSKILFWIVGLNVLFIYSLKKWLKVNDFINIIKKVLIIAFIFTLAYFSLGLFNEKYNIASYLVLFMYPMLLYSTKGFKQNMLYVLIAAISILITLKRGAMLAFAVSSLIYYFGIVYTSFSAKKMFLGILFISLISITAFLSMKLQAERVGQRFDEEQIDLENDKAGSGRIGMYKRLYYEWESAPILTKIFGFGNQEDSRRFKGKRRTHAHSDILGHLYNQGYIGIFIIILIYLSIIKYYFKLRKNNKEQSIVILSSFVILVMVNFYSGMFRATDAIYLFSIFPFFQTQLIYERQNYYSFKSA